MVTTNRRAKRSITLYLSAAILVITSYVLSFYFFSQTEYTDCIIEHVETTERFGNRVFTTCGDFQIQDVPLRGIENSRELFDHIQVYQQFESITTIGYRIPAISLYPVIIEVRP